MCSQVTTYFNAAYFHENSIFWCKLIASLAQWTRYSTEHSNHEKEGREIGSRSEWTDRYYKVINCDGIGALRMRLSPPGEHWTWRAPAPQPRSDENSDHESQMSEKGEEGKWQIDCVNKSVCVLSWWKRWPQPIQTGVIMCKYGTVFTAEGILWTHIIALLQPSVFRSIQSRRDWVWGEMCVIDSRQ